VLYVLGYANVDVIARVPRLAGDGDRVTALGIDLFPGGMAANCACAAAQLGTPTQLLAAIGIGGLADVLIDDLVSRGVGTRYLHRGERTTIAVITVTPDGQRTIVSEPVGYHPDLVRSALAEATGSERLLYVDGYHLGWARQEISLARRLGFTVYCDLDGAPDTYRAEDVGVVLNEVDIVQLNHAIATTWLPGGSDRERGEWLSRRVNAVIMTRGADAVDVTVGEASASFSVPDVDDVRDTTGAGDIFAGAVLHHLVSGESLLDAVPRAIRVASQSVMHPGARLPRAFRG